MRTKLIFKLETYISCTDVSLVFKYDAHIAATFTLLFLCSLRTRADTCNTTKSVKQVNKCLPPMTLFMQLHIKYDNAVLMLRTLAHI